MSGPGRLLRGSLPRSGWGTDMVDEGVQVGWLVVLDGSTWCVECFAGAEDVAAYWAGDGGEGVMVGRVDRGFAVATEVTCRRCGRLLAQVRPR